MASSGHRTLSLLCILCACICSCSSGSTFTVTKDMIADAWQSSSLASTGCFRESADRIDRWSYFHSGDSPDSSGYQWLLLKLTRGVRVLSVTVHARSAEPDRASNTEVWLSDRLPTDLLSMRSSCHGNIRHDMSGFSYCGRGGHGKILKHEVKCRSSDCPQLTEVILLRRFVRNQTDKYFNFQRIEIHQTSNTSLFLVCKPTGGKLLCNNLGLKSLQLGNRVIVKACLPCHLSTHTNRTCFWQSSDGKHQRYIEIIKPERDSALLKFALETRMHGWRLQCSYWCPGGGMRTAQDTIGVFVTPKAVKLTLGSQTLIGVQQFWVVGKDAVFNFSTEVAFPRPQHECRLVDGSADTEWELRGFYRMRIPHRRYFDTGRVLVPEAEIKHNTSGSFAFYSLMSKFKLRVNSSLKNWIIFCKSQLQGTGESTFKAELIPPLLHPAQITSIQLQSAQMRSGSNASFSIRMADPGNPSAQFNCTIAGRHIVSMATVEQWQFIPMSGDNGHRISCQVMQKSRDVAVYSQQVSSQTLDVKYPASNSWSAAHTLVVMEGETLSVSVTSLGGNPVPSHQCWMLTADRHDLKVKSEMNLQDDERRVVSNFSVTSTRRMNGGSVMCRVTQEGQPDMSQNLSQSIKVYFSASSISWSGQLTNGTELLLMLLTEEGNPRPELDCSLRSQTVRIKRMTVFTDSDVDGVNGGWSRRVRLEQRFMEPQPEVTVTCEVTQRGPDSVTSFLPAINIKTFANEQFFSSSSVANSTSGGPDASSRNCRQLNSACCLHQSGSGCCGCCRYCCD